jgi:hypothetical protein
MARLGRQGLSRFVFRLSCCYNGSRSVKLCKMKMKCDENEARRAAGEMRGADRLNSSADAEVTRYHQQADEKKSEEQCNLNWK